MLLTDAGVPQEVKEAIGERMRKSGEKNEQVVQASVVNPDVPLWCDMALLNGRTVRTLATIDTKAKYVKFEGGAHGAFEYRDGYFGKVITGGYMVKEAINVRQFVTIDESKIRFGFTNKGTVEENTIDRRTGIFRSAGRITQCTEVKARQ